MGANAGVLTDDTQVSLHANDAAVPHGREGCQACFEFPPWWKSKGKNIKHVTASTSRQMF